MTYTIYSGLKSSLMVRAQAYSKYKLTSFNSIKAMDVLNRIQS